MVLKDYFVFGGESSADFGFYASGENVYNSPEKEYEIFEVPGRSGDVAIDNKRYKNITVKYPCYYQKVGGNLSKDISDFRNMLLSKSGYQRLYDSHNPEEYRLAICRNVIEIDPTEYDLIGAVEIEFDCKPQRYLVSGETQVTVTSGDEIVNPTLFESRPLLMVDGMGEITINDQMVNVISEPLGYLQYTDSASYTGTGGRALVCPAITNTVYEGDRIRRGLLYWDIKFKFLGNKIRYVSAVKTSSDEGLSVRDITVEPHTYIRVYVWALNTYISGDVDPVIGTDYEKTLSTTLSVTYLDANNDENTVDVTLSYTFTFGENGLTLMPTEITTTNTSQVIEEYLYATATQVYSTVPSIGRPLYLDLESGEAYKYEDDEYVSVNNSVWLGADMPVLKPGVNEITYDNTVHDFKIVPRWWKV